MRNLENRYRTFSETAAEVSNLALPKLTPEERRRALEKARDIRQKRAELRARLKSGELTLEDVLARKDDEVAGKMRVSYLLQSLPRVGKVTSAKIMEDIGIDDNRRVQGLGRRQIEALLERFGA